MYYKVKHKIWKETMEIYTNSYCWPTATAEETESNIFTPTKIRQWQHFTDSIRNKLRDADEVRVQEQKYSLYHYASM